MFLFGFFFFIENVQRVFHKNLLTKKNETYTDGVVTTRKENEIL